DHEPKVIAQGPTDDLPTITLTKADGSPMKCVVLSEGVRADGSKISTVRVVDSGEIVTMVEAAQPSQPVARRSSLAKEKVEANGPPSLVDNSVHMTGEPNPSMSGELVTAKPTLMQRVKDRLHGADRGGEMAHETVVSSKTVEESKPVDKKMAT